MLGVGLGEGDGVGVGVMNPGGGAIEKGLEVFFFSAIHPSFRKRFHVFFHKILHSYHAWCQFITWGVIAEAHPSLGGMEAQVGRGEALEG